MTPPLFKDMLGREIRVGDIVAYSIRVGNVAETRVATVLEIEWVEKMDGGYWTWKVGANWESCAPGEALALQNSRPSSPSVSKAVRVATGPNW